MVEGMKLLYIVVEEEEKGDDSFRYTRSVLQSTLQLMGCKPRHAFKISKQVFEMIKSGCQTDGTLSGMGTSKDDFLEKGELLTEKCLDNKNESIPFELYKRRTTAVVTRRTFINVVCDALAEYKYVCPNQKEDLILACRIRERKESVTILLCGTSGCGKSTLSALLGSRLGITTVISTDSIRHMMRSFVDEKQNPLLWASTYHAGEYLDPVAVAEAKGKRKAKKHASGPSLLPKNDNEGQLENLFSESGSDLGGLVSPKQMAVEGFKAQSEMVIDSLDRLLTAWEERKESVVVEGVHLSLNFVMGLMKRHPSIIPFMVCISNEEKHLERFAVRAKYMTLDPAKNKYVKYIKNIRTIQEYLCNRADKHLVPKINNTNVDRSVAAIHATVFSCLRRREAGEKIYDPIRNTVPIVDEEYKNQLTANSLKSKGMFQLIQRKGSSRHLMALVNNDGSVAKAWPVGSIDSNGKSVDASQNGIGVPMYGPLQICKSEPVNLQFGHFGISAWPNDTGCASIASSGDESRIELTDNASKSYSSSCSTPRYSEGHAKELKEEHYVHGSDEEVDDASELESDEDLSDDSQKHHDEMEGSVDEESTKSDEEYEDLVMEDEESIKPDEEYEDLVMEGAQENGYLSDDGRLCKLEAQEKMVPYLENKLCSGLNGELDKRNVDWLIKTRSKFQLEKPCRGFYAIL